jgi:hypothetical protein
MRRLLLLAVLGALCCRPDFDRSIALVPAPRILAVRAEPPESAPGTLVNYTALAVTPSGSDAQADVAWSFCSTPASTIEHSPIATPCLTVAGAMVASGAQATLITPADACQRFGPQGLPAPPGQTAPRPSAPDPTGGYYQPLVLGWQGGTTAAFERLTCDPTGVSLDLARTYRATRVPNQNPRLLPPTADIDGAPIDLTGLTGQATIGPGASVHVYASWSPDSAESYAVIDVLQQSLDGRPEILWVSWFATAGDLDKDVSAPSSAATTADNVWHAPVSSGTFYLWIVLHDDRGGTDFSEIPVVVP